MPGPKRIRVIESHTGGEPTRTVISGGEGIGSDTLMIRRERFRDEFDHLRSAITNEPRGSDSIVGALLCEPVDKSCVTGANVPSYRLASKVSVNVTGHGPVVGDVAWGGNWFFLVNDHGQDISLGNLEVLTDFTWRIRQALNEAAITGEGGQEIDHIELFAPSEIEGVNSKNFVLCPGKAYDRSPCGTGTSAKLACLVADNKLAEGQVWRQESIVGSIFEGSVRISNSTIHPSIKGSAFITAEADLILDDRDPFCMGIRS